MDYSEHFTQRVLNPGLIRFSGNSERNDQKSEPSNYFLQNTDLLYVHITTPVGIKMPNNSIKVVCSGMGFDLEIGCWRVFHAEITSLKNYSARRYNVFNPSIVEMVKGAWNLPDALAVLEVINFFMDKKIYCGQKLTSFSLHGLNRIIESQPEDLQNQLTNHGSYPIIYFFPKKLTDAQFYQKFSINDILSTKMYQVCCFDDRGNNILSRNTSIFWKACCINGDTNSYFIGAQEIHHNVDSIDDQSIQLGDDEEIEILTLEQAVTRIACYNSSINEIDFLLKQRDNLLLKIDDISEHCLVLVEHFYELPGVEAITVRAVDAEKRNFMLTPILPKDKINRFSGTTIVKKL